jgi:hypothetical protein
MSCIHPSQPASRSNPRQSGSDSIIDAPDPRASVVECARVAPLSWRPTQNSQRPHGKPVTTTRTQDDGKTKCNQPQPAPEFHLGTIHDDHPNAIARCPPFANLDCGGKRSATPLSPATKSSEPKRPPLPPTAHSHLLPPTDHRLANPPSEPLENQGKPSKTHQNQARKMTTRPSAWHTIPRCNDVTMQRFNAPRLPQTQDARH